MGKKNTPVQVHGGMVQYGCSHHIVSASGPVQKIYLKPFGVGSTGRFLRYKNRCISGDVVFVTVKYCYR